MSWVFWVGIGAVVIILVYAVRRGADDSARKPALPSHYNPMTYYVDPTTIPGWCAHCETMNDPEYRFCENCTEKLPEVEHETTARFDAFSFGRD